jgi:methionyl-tRNA formyltransferase
VTYASKIEKHEARLDFSRPAEAVERQVRAFNPSPGAFFEYGGERIKVLAAVAQSGEGSAFGAAGPGPSPGNVVGEDLGIQCGDGVLVPVLVQRAGRGVMSPAELLRGFPIPVGAKLA